MSRKIFVRRQGAPPSEQTEPFERCGNHGHLDSFPFRRVQVFQALYQEYVCKHLTHLFPRLVSYNRFVELEKEVLLPLAVFSKQVLLGTCTGISFVDSTPLRVYRGQRILIHKTFKGLAERGKCSLGWFFSFKLHLIINDKGEILNFTFTPGNVDGRAPLKQEKFLKKHKGQALCGQRLYRAGFVREPFPGRHTIDNQSKEQHEELPDDRCG